MMNRGRTARAVILYKLTVLESMGGSTAKLLALHEVVVEVSVSGRSGYIIYDPGERARVFRERGREYSAKLLIIP